MVLPFLSRGGDTILVIDLLPISSLLLLVFFLFPNMDNVLRDWNRLSLTEDEGARANLQNNQAATTKEFILATRLLTRRVLNVEVVG